MGFDVYLTHPERVIGAQAGIMRRVSGQKNNRKEKPNTPTGGGWQRDVEGALAEMALAKHYGVYWPGPGAFRGGDVGRVEVRNTEKHGNRLWFYKEDKPYPPYFLVTGINGHYRIQGWAWAEDGRKEEFWEDPKKQDRWAYYLPRNLLKPPPATMVEFLKLAHTTAPSCREREMA